MFFVNSEHVSYTEDALLADYIYSKTLVAGDQVIPVDENYQFKTQLKVPRTGLMLVGWGGNNGSTVSASILANKKGLSWETKEGVQKPNYFGSMIMSSTTRLGTDAKGDEVHIPLRDLLPMAHPNDLVVGGWDISSVNIADAVKRAQVLDIDLQRQLKDDLKVLKPLPSIYIPDFIAANQADRADNVLTGTIQEQMDKIRQDIRDFKANNNLDKVIVLWTANTERFSAISAGLNDTSENLLAAIARGEKEISPSTLFAVACVLEGVTYINGSPQNTFVPGLVQLAEEKDVFLAGDDFKSGQTKMKSVLVDFLVSAGIKPRSIVSYNHLGNNDGKNLSAPQTFRSKEISKSNVVDDMVASNKILYEDGEHPDHVVVIKYLPYVKDSKRAMDEYTSEIFMGGKNTIVMHNTCEDSLLATPLIFDLVILAELCERIQIKKEGGAWERFHSVLSILSYMLKAPMVPPGTPVINSLFAQRQCIISILRACMGLAPDNYMMLEHKLPSQIRSHMHLQAAAPSHSVATNGFSHVDGNGLSHADSNGCRKVSKDTFTKPVASNGNGVPASLPVNN